MSDVRPTLEQIGGWGAVLGPLSMGENLSSQSTHAALVEILSGQVSDARIAGFIVGLRIKGETVDEVSGMVDAMLDTCEPITLDDGVIDIVGTGGSPTRRLHALNVSTMAAIVAGSAGARVCKHGNRKASSTSGAFDLLDELGVAIELGPESVARCVAETSVGFAFARAHHPAMRFVGPVRAELGIPTVFNLLGPLSHPGRIRRQVIGVGDPRVVELVAGVMAARRAPRAMVVHGADSLDEITLNGPTTIYEIVDGQTRTYELKPSDLGLPERSADELRGGDPARNAELARAVFGGAPGAARDIVVANAAAALWVAGIVDELVDGVARAQTAIDQGQADATLERLVSVSNAEAAAVE